VDPGALTRQVMDPDLHNKTAADSLDARHETTDQKVATVPTLNFISVLSRASKRQVGTALDYMQDSSRGGRRQRPTGRSRD
jgi:hypothetical protein